MSKITDKTLRQNFDDFNGAYFEGKVKDVEVKFGKTGDANGFYDTEKKLIVIDRVDRDHGNGRHIKISLLHEMIHAYLDIVDGYVGHEEDPLHGTRFKGEICRLWRIGAYDGLL